MLHDRQDGTRIDYRLYRFGTGQLRFRGPCPDLNEGYVVIVGGATAFGPGARRPFAYAITQQLPFPVLNLGYPASGPDLYLSDPVLQVAIAKARAMVLVPPCALSLTNRLYRVHPRRNDRVIEFGEAMRQRCAGFDLENIVFVGHLARTLSEVDPVTFSELVAEVKAAWVARMSSLMRLSAGRTVLLWAARHPPADVLMPVIDQLQRHPPLVDQQMMDTIAVDAARVVECVTDAPILPEPKPADEPIPPSMQPHDPQIDESHAKVADMLLPALRDMLEGF